MNPLSALRQAMQSGEVVRLERRRFEEASGASFGMVVGLSDALVLLNVVSDRIDLDGFEILRLDDITSASADFEARHLYAAALAHKRCSVQSPGAVALGGMREAIESIGTIYPLVSIFREGDSPDEVAIGRVEQVLPSGVRLRWITPAGVWEEDDTVYEFDSITRLEFGREYENTLAWYAAQSGR